MSPEGEHHKPQLETFDTTPPPEEFDRYRAEAKAKRERKDKAAEATFEANQKLGITKAPEAIKKRYPKLRALEAQASAQTELFPEPGEPTTPVDQ